MSGSRLVWAAAVIVICGMGGTAHAAKIHRTELTIGKKSVTFEKDGVTVVATADGGHFAKSVLGGMNSWGVSGGGAGSLIDGNQSITFTFNQPVSVTKLGIAHLFQEGIHDNREDEIASFLTNDSSFRLIADQDIFADWNGGGAVTNLSPGTLGSAGAWKIKGLDIFDGPVTSLTLISGSPGQTKMFSDFGFRVLKFKVAAVPTPGALTLLGTAGLMSLRSRRRD